LQTFSQAVINAEWEQARRLYPTIQLSQATIPVERIPELVMKSWEFVCRTGRVAPDDYNPGVVATDTPNAEAEEWREKLQPLVQAAREEALPW
jgi:hypothetical protein